MRSSLLVAAILTTVTSSSDAAIFLPLYGNDTQPWGQYGGDVEYGQVTWEATDGEATFTVEVDPSFTIFGFSFNTTIPSTDFHITVLGSGDWSYRGLSTTEGIGTDRFDFTVYRSLPGTANLLQFTVIGSAISDDADFFRPNLLESNPIEWDAILHRSHFGAYVARGDGVNYILSDSFHSGSSDSVVPEPSTLTILGLSIFGLALGQLRRRLGAASL